MAKYGENRLTTMQYATSPQHKKLRKLTNSKAAAQVDFNLLG